MTTIVCSRSEMACDLQMTIHQQFKVKAKTKIYLIEPHDLHFAHESFIMGFCGSATEIIQVVDFYERPELYKDIPRTKNLQGLVLTKSGKIFQFDTPSQWLAVEGNFAAMGSGAPSAYGALHVGASPKEAVQAAMKVDPFTGMGTKVLSFK